LRERFVRQVEQITWQYKLAPETINLPARSGVAEIEIFDIALKTDALDEDVLRAIDRAIPLPIVFQLQHGQRTRMVAAYKRPSAAEAGKWVIDGYFAGAWQPPPNAATAHRPGSAQPLRTTAAQPAAASGTAGRKSARTSGTADPVAQPAE
jgi:hypothetical protein